MRQAPNPTGKDEIMPYDNERKDIEVELLQRFVNGKKVEEDEYPILENYASLGIVKIWPGFKKREVYAILTQSGKNILGIT